MKSNTELLHANKDFLSSIDKQRQFILQRLTQPNGCPSCGQMQNYFQGMGIDIDDYQDTTEEPIATCINGKCGRQLEYVVPLFASGGNGGWKWSLVPINQPD